jgi:hypothetical protein
VNRTEEMPEQRKALVHAVEDHSSSEKLGDGLG